MIGSTHFRYCELEASELDVTMALYAGSPVKRSCTARRWPGLRAGCVGRWARCSHRTISLYFRKPTIDLGE